jgi:RNA polymerase sigma-70 factor (ECF subfamily)
MSATWRLETALVERLYRAARGSEWVLAKPVFAAALERSARKYFGDVTPEPSALERYLSSLHLADLALACACAEGSNPAWDHFVREFRPGLYRAASAIDASGGARDLADSLYGELFGLTSEAGARRSHLDYYHGRSALGTWLRAVLAQRYVDRVRSRKSLEPLPEDDAPHALAAPAVAPDPAWPRAVERLRAALKTAVAALAPRDRLRLACYHAQSMTLAQIGKMLGEHEATVSRHLSRTRKVLRSEVERNLRERERMSEVEIAECFAAVTADPGALDVGDLVGEARKDPALGRSTE